MNTFLELSGSFINMALVGEIIHHHNTEATLYWPNSEVPIVTLTGKDAQLLIAWLKAHRLGAEFAKEASNGTF